MLHPQLVSLRGDWPIVNHGHNEEAWRLWFANYTDFIIRYAWLAESIGADYFVIGNEMYGTTQREEEWRGVAAAVRHVYTGRITYAAHILDVFSVKWWDAVDAIGVNPYFPLTESNNPSPAQLKSAWEPIASRLEALSRQWNRAVVFTEISYPALDGANHWGGWLPALCNAGSEPTIDFQEQADLYEALLSSFSGKPWWLGVFWWAWGANPGDGDPYAPDPFGPPVNTSTEGVLRRYYGVAPRPTATPISAMVEDPSRQLVIYDDNLNTAWTVSEWGVKADFGYEADRYQGQAAIRVAADGPLFELVHMPAVDLSTYDLLEFYVKFVGKAPLALGVGLGNWSPQFHEVTELSLAAAPSYVVPAGYGWSRVRVPLSELFRAEAEQPERNITELRFVFHKSCSGFVPPYSEVLFDEIRFVGLATP